MSKTIIEALYEYFKDCPLMGNDKINVDFLPEKGVEYSIDTTPATQIIKRYINGDTLRQYLFVIRSVHDYGSDVLQNIANSGFYENLSDWLEQQDKAAHYPTLPSGKEATAIRAQGAGYLFTMSPDSGRYQVQCRLEYWQKG